MTYDIPTYETAELFVDKLLRNKVLSRNPIVDDILDGQLTALSLRSTQRNFAATVGLTRKFIEQVKRAQAAEALLRNQIDHSVASLAAQTGYADQAHMARSLKLLYGRTPSQLAHTE